jgi:hypothetical protein
MSKVHLSVLALAGLLAMAPAAQAQNARPYIGFVYPAGGQRGTTFQVELGGQGLDDVDRALVSGAGVSAKVVEYHRKLNPQENQLLREQLRDLRRAPHGSAIAALVTSGPAMMTSGDAMMSSGTAPSGTFAKGKGTASQQLIARIEKRLADYVQRPESMSISNIVLLEVTMAAGAKPGPREIRLATPRGVSNPLVFHVGQVPEVCRKPMVTSQFEVLGKEELALRHRPDTEVEDVVSIPCTANGQVASGEVNRYRFEARKGQRLVISADARQLIPYMADAVPGWFQAVLALYDAHGKEVAYNDDYRFKPDPTIFYEVPKDGQYVLAIYDAIYRGREDFVYRITIGEMPFVTSIFPLGGRAGDPLPPIHVKGWNLEKAVLWPPSKDAKPGLHWIAARTGGLLSNRVPFALDTLPECFEQEPNNDPAHAQKVKLPVIVNGRINRPGDCDVFQFTGHAGETVVAEVTARRLDSPLDSVLKLTDAAGKLLALNDDHEDVEAGLDTHDADSYLSVKLPADGTYYVHLSDTACQGGEEYAYRLRLSAPRPDFALRVVPSSVSFRSQGYNAVTVYAIRKDGFTGPIKLSLKDPPPGFSAYPIALLPGQTVTRLGVKTDLADSKQPVTLAVEGHAKIDGRDVAHDAVPAEDKMQAFLWRHLVPAAELKALVVDPSYVPVKRRVPHLSPLPATPVNTTPAASGSSAAKPKFTKKQVAGRLRELQLLFEEGLLTDVFYNEKVAECEAAQ